MRSRSEFVRRVKTGHRRATPSSVAFSTMKSVPDFLTGAKISQRSTGARWSPARSSTTSRPPRRPTSAISAIHSPSRPLKTAMRAPIP